MDSDEFRRRGKELIDFIADHVDAVRSRLPRSEVRPNFLLPHLPKSAPEEAEDWEDVMKDVKKLIVPGVTEWQHPNFHGFYPCGFSFASMCGELLATGLGGVGFSWASSPAITELEKVVTDWLGRSIGLPETFMTSDTGGGIIACSASEVTFTCLLAARNRALDEVRSAQPDLSEHEIFSRLVGYHSNQAHTSAPRAGLLGVLRLRALPTDGDYRLRGDTLADAVRKDRADGLIPFFCLATLGTTGSCAFDSIEELGVVATAEGMWLHVDAAYAGSALVCPEYRYLIKGIEMATSFNFNPHKWLLVHPDCSVVWYQDIQNFVKAFNMDAPFLKYEGEEQVSDYRHWQIPFGRRFRSLKLWMVLRLYGIEGLQEYIRGHCRLAEFFADLLRKEPQFEVIKVVLGLVCFRLEGPDARTQALIKLIEKEKRVYLVYSEFERESIHYLRFCVCAEDCNEKDILRSFGIIKKLAAQCADIEVL